AELEAHFGAPASSTSLAFVAALHRLGLQRVAVAATYPEPVLARLVELLGGAGLEVVGVRSRGIFTAAEVATLGEAVLLRFAEALLTDIGQASFMVGDVRERATADRVVATALERHGRLDVLVNNAAIDHTGDVLDTPIEEVRTLFDVNVFGAIHMLQAAGRAMRGRGGAIVNVTSRLASIGVPTMAMYSAAKGALLSLTRGAAVELAPEGIRVDAVAPGMTRRPLFE